MGRLEVCEHISRFDKCGTRLPCVFFRWVAFSCNEVPQTSAFATDGNDALDLIHLVTIGVRLSLRRRTVEALRSCRKLGVAGDIWLEATDVERRV